MDKLYIIIPAYNEEETLQDVIAQWHSVVTATGEDGRLVVINDGSKDSTYDIMKQCEEKYPQLIALTKENGGHGDTLLYGYHYALEHDADYIFQTDSDGQTDPAQFPGFWRDRKKYDMVIGYRRGRQDGASRVFVTKTLKAVLWLTFHVKVTDANTPFRLMKREALAHAIQKIPQHYNLPNVMISVVFAKEKRPVSYRPITFKPRQGGVNSINFKKIIGIGKQAWHDFHAMRKNI